MKIVATSDKAEHEVIFKFSDDLDVFEIVEILGALLLAKGYNHESVCLGFSAYVEERNEANND